MEDKEYGPEKHIEELGISPTFELEEGRVEPKEPTEHLEEERERRWAIEAQRKETRRELARLRSGSVLADHGAGEEEDDIVRMHLNQPNLWRRGPRR